MLTTNTGAAILRPEDVHTLLVQPALGQSVAAQVSTTVTTTSSSFRIPLVTADPSAEWVAEGDEITPSQPTLDELVVIPSKLAGLTVITRELAEDSSPEAATAVGLGLARDIARKLDAAYFGDLDAPAQAGLDSLSGIQTIVSASAFANLDAFANAISLAETVGATVTSFVTTPAVALTLAQVKTATGSNQPLLGMDGTLPGVRRILGVPMYVSPAVASGTLWALDESRCFLVVRSDATIETDSSVFFTSDRVAVKATMRVGIGFPHAGAVVKVTTS